MCGTNFLCVGFDDIVFIDVVLHTLCMKHRARKSGEGRHYSRHMCDSKLQRMSGDPERSRGMLVIRHNNRHELGKESCIRHYLDRCVYVG